MLAKKKKRSASHFYRSPVSWTLSEARLLSFSATYEHNHAWVHIAGQLEIHLAAMLFCCSVTDKSEFWFCASVFAFSAHGNCQSLLSFLNELHWEMRVHLIWSHRGSIRPVSLLLSHTHPPPRTHARTQRWKRKLLFLQNIRSSQMHIHWRHA